MQDISKIWRAGRPGVFLVRREADRISFKIVPNRKTKFLSIPWTATDAEGVRRELQMFRHGSL